MLSLPTDVEKNPKLRYLQDVKTNLERRWAWGKEKEAGKERRGEQKRGADGRGGGGGGEGKGGKGGDRREEKRKTKSKRIALL